MGHFTRVLRPHLPNATPIDFREYPNTYKGRKRTIYAKAVESLLQHRITRDDARVKTFVKAEKINLTAKPDPPPRVIQPRNPRYHTMLGSYIKHIEHDTMEAIDKAFQYPTIMSGYNTVQQGKIFEDAWHHVSDPVAIGLDASRFDQHVSREMLEWEHTVWLSMFEGPHREELAKLLGWQLTTEGVGYTRAGKIKYRVEGRRMSGDVNTSAGNKLIMCGMIYAYMLSRGFNVHEYRLLNNGDDCVLIIPRRTAGRLNNLDRWFRQMGFTMTREAPVYQLEHIEFCQTHPVRVGDTYRMVRNFPLCMDKDTTMIPHADTHSNVRRWAYAVGKAGLAVAGGVPIVNRLYLKYTEWGRGLPAWKGDDDGGLNRLARGLEPNFQHPDTETRVSFWKAFGVIPSHQVLMERMIDNLELEVNKRKRIQPSPTYMSANHMLATWDAWH